MLLFGRSRPDGLSGYAPIESRVDIRDWGIAHTDGSTGCELLPKVTATFEWIRLAQRVPAFLLTRVDATTGATGKKVLKQIAELVMKRMEGEKPSSGGQSGGKASAEQQKRWDALSPLLVGSMQALCRQPTIADVESWREWWKENKKKPWKDSDA